MVLHAPPRRRRTDLDLAEMEPELPRALLCQRDRYCDGIVALADSLT